MTIYNKYDVQDQQKEVVAHFQPQKLFMSASLFGTGSLPLIRQNYEEHKDTYWDLSWILFSKKII